MKIRKIESLPKFQSETLMADVKLKVACYVRVSTSKDEQKNSFAAQIDFYTKKIKMTPEWEFAGAYYDNGISGTSKENASKTVFGDMIICGCCGTPIRKYTEKIRGKMVNYWKCVSKEEGCKQRGIREDFLKNTLSEVLGFEQFDIERLKETVESMTFGANRIFTIVTKDGRIIKLKLGGMNNGYSYEDTCNTE